MVPSTTRLSRHSIQDTATTMDQSLLQPQQSPLSIGSLSAQWSQRPHSLNRKNRQPVAAASRRAERSSWQSSRRWNLRMSTSMDLTPSQRTLHRHCIDSQE
jgi:hypothetical protein